MGNHCHLSLLFLVVICLQGAAQGSQLGQQAAGIYRNLARLFRTRASLNVVLVIDAAGGHVERRNFPYVRKLVAELVQGMPERPNHRLGIIAASSKSAVYYSLQNALSRVKALSALNSVAFGGRKSLLGGIDQAVALIRKQKYWKKRHNVIVQISTGPDKKVSSKDVEKLQGCLKYHRIHFFTFALYHASYNRLRQITSKPLNKHYFRIAQYAQLRLITKLLAKEVAKRKGKVVFDKCHRLCLKTGNKLRFCTRIRKDFTSMSAMERKRWINTYKLASRKQPYKKTFDGLVLLHKVLFETSIHQKNEFLPWHRWYILQLENLLRKIDCRVTMPYWDWSLWSHDPWNTNHLWSSKPSGFGGNGTAPTFCVTEGPFAAQRWEVAPSARMNNLTCLRRTQNGKPPDAAAVQILLRTPVNKANLFEENLRVNFHDRVHCNFADDGHMCSLDSAASPEFFLHHGFVDKTWNDFQKQSSSKKKALFSILKRKKMRGTNYTPADLHDLRRQPGGVRVIYDNPTHDHAKTIFKILGGMSAKTLDNLPRSTFSPISRHALKIFHVGNRELAMSNRFERMIKPHNIVKEKQLHGVDEELGILL